MSSPKLSIIIINYKAAELLRTCLRSIQNLLTEIPFEICVVDNASQDGCKEMIEKEFPSVLFIANEKNDGFARALNQGLWKTTAPYVLWLNPDAEFKDGKIAQVIANLDAEPKIGIAGLRIENTDGSLQLSCRSFPSYTTALFNRYSFLTRWFPNNPLSRRYLRTDFDHQKIQEVDWVSGACLLHKRDVLKNVGYPDEQFFMYCEDVDFCLRVKQAGWRVIYHPGARVLHHIGASSGHVIYRMTVIRHLSMWRYYSKHFKRNWVKDAAVASGIFLRCLFCLGLTLLRKAKP